MSTTSTLPPPPPPHLEINTKEWSYLAEGGFHIILRYDGQDVNLKGKILRIGKKSLGHVASEKPAHAGTEGDGDTSATQDAAKVGVSTAPKLDEAGARRRFERGVLIPVLGEQYVQPGDAVTLSRDDIHSIHDSFDHLRPSGRIGRDSGHWSSAAQLEPDKTAFWLKLPGDPSTPITPQPSPSTPPPAADEAAEQGQEAEAQHKEDIVLAVEIKPKGAVMPVGTLVPAPNRLKYRVPRFDAQQKFKAQDSQNWGAIDRPTGYHPMELYSGDARRTSATLKELLKTPQNKLRGWENGKMLFGAGSEGSGAKAANAEATAALGRAVEHAGLNTGGGYGGTPAEDLMDLVGEVLAKEPLVSRLVAAQALDVLEVEGGGLVFERLVSLCGGSTDDALDLLESKEADPFAAEDVAPALLLPQETLAALQAGSEVEGMDSLYSKAVQRVEELSVDECIQLLRRYLIALGVMDCSVMMSLRAVPQSQATAGTAIQRGDAAGVLIMEDGRCLAYCVSVVDAGPKPPTKLRRKAKHEHKIWEFMKTLST